MIHWHQIVNMFDWRLRQLNSFTFVVRNNMLFAQKFHKSQICPTSVVMRSGEQLCGWTYR